MSLKPYTYHIDTGGGLLDIDQFGGANALALKYEPYGEDMFEGYSIAVDGTIVLSNESSNDGPVYDTILGLSETATVDFVIKREGIEVYRGQIAKRDCDFDLDRKTVTVKPKRRSVIEKVQNKWDKKLNILDVVSTVTVAVNYTTSLSFICTLQDNYDAGVGFEKVVEFKLDNSPLTFHYLYAREESNIKPPETQDGWVYDKAAKEYVRSHAYAYNINTVHSIGNNSPGSGWTYVCYDSGYDSYIWVEDSSVQDQNRTINVDNGRRLSDVIQLFLDDMGLGLTYKSAFFKNDNYPDGTSPGTGNYVTGTDPNPLNNMVLHQLSDVTNYDASENATIAEMKLRDIVQALYEMFRVHVSIEGSEFRLEHVSYYSKQQGTDITALTQPSGRLWIEHMNKYNYRADDAKNYKIEFQQAWENKGEYLIYVDADAEFTEKSVQLVSDYSGLMTHVDDASLEAVFISVVNSADEMRSESSVLNYHLSWKALPGRYHLHNQPYTNLLINGSSATAQSLMKLKQQTPGKLPKPGSWVPDELMKSELGWGEVAEAEIELNTNMLTVTLNHE